MSAPVSDPKTIVITGASDGVGAAAARKLVADGHHVIVVGRSRAKTEAIAAELGASYYVVDFAVLDQVRALAASLTAAYPHIDVLANNAGGLFGDRTKTVDGFELTFQVNHLAPFLLTHLLMEPLLRSKASVIQTSSLMARMMGKVVLDDLQHERDFSMQLAYATTKLENILFTQELHRRFHDRGLSAAAFHPGVVASNFASQSTSRMTQWFYGSSLGRMFMVTPEKGADQLVWLAEGTPDRDWISGTYYEKRRPARRVNPQVRDPQLGVQLWERSAAVLGL